MQVKNILQQKGRDVIAIASHATLADAARLLAERRIGAVIVQTEDGGVAGILSERDIVRALGEMQAESLAHPVSRHMTKNVATCAEADSVDEIMEMMTSGRFRHVPVMHEGRLAGIVSIGDVVKTRIAETVQEAQSLREYIVAS